MDLDNLTKLVQIGFYATGATVAVLTYRSAKRGLLNTVNTEYQKRVIERLHALAEELLSEFDPGSPNYWAAKGIIEEAVRQINKDYEATVNLPGGPHLIGI